jgi:hypothetical protein
VPPNEARVRLLLPPVAPTAATHAAEQMTARGPVPAPRIFVLALKYGIPYVMR